MIFGLSYFVFQVPLLHSIDYWGGRGHKNYEFEKLKAAFMCMFFFLNYGCCPYIRLCEETPKLDNYSSIRNKKNVLEKLRMTDFPYSYLNLGTFK